MKGLSFTRKTGQSFTLQFGGQQAKISIVNIIGRRAIVNIDAPADIKIRRDDVSDGPMEGKNICQQTVKV